MKDMKTYIQPITGVQCVSLWNLCAGSDPLQIDIVEDNKEGGFGMAPGRHLYI